jgi:hypothetical protein
VRCLEIIGEAATQLPEETHASIPNVPWAGVRGMRNRLIHAYFSVDPFLSGTLSLSICRRSLEPSFRAFNKTTVPGPEPRVRLAAQREDGERAERLRNQAVAIAHL